MIKIDKGEKLKNKNKYGMFAGWDMMKIADKKGQEIAEKICKVKMLTSSASFKFKKQCCSLAEFGELTLQGNIKKNRKGKLEAVVILENEFLFAKLKFVEFRHNHCSL